MRGHVAIITKPSPHYVPTESTISGRDVVLIPGLLPIFLHSCEIKSGWGLGTRLPPTLDRTALQQQLAANNFQLTFIWIGTCSPPPVLPTPVSSTLDQKVAFRLLIKRHQSDVKLHLEVGLSLKMYLGCIIVTSCAITGFVCTKSWSSWVYLPVQVCWYSRSDPKQADSNWTVHYTAGSWSTLSSKAIRRDRELKECFEKIMLEKICTKNICTH